jgi:hypothetical protein
MLTLSAAGMDEVGEYLKGHPQDSQPDWED